MSGFESRKASSDGLWRIWHHRIGGRAVRDDDGEDLTFPTKAAAEAARRLIERGYTDIDRDRNEHVHNARQYRR